VGLDDRDYMRERNRRNFDNLVKDSAWPFTPPAEKQSFVGMVLFWVALAFILYKLYGWWEPRKTARANHVATATQQPTERVQAPEPPRAAPGVPGVDTAPARVLQASRQLYTPSPTPAAPVEVAPPQTSGTIYLCKNYSGGTFWAQAHCGQHNALIDRMASVPPGMPFDQQVQLAEQRRAAIQTVVVHNAPVTTAAEAPSNKSECAILDNRVDQLDAMARQPQGASTQDGIRSERQKTRDRQFALHC
jgi:hypothetical protein